MKQVGQIAGLATELGITMGLTSAGLIFLGLWGGRQLDAMLGTGPFATITLLLLGVILGQIAIIRLAMRARRYLMQVEDYAFTTRDAAASLWTAARALALMVAPVVLRLVGLWLDGLFGTGVAFSLALVLLGLFLGVVGLLQLAASSRASDRKR